MHMHITCRSFQKLALFHIVANHTPCISVYLATILPFNGLLSILFGNSIGTCLDQFISIRLNKYSFLLVKIVVRLLLLLIIRLNVIRAIG